MANMHSKDYRILKKRLRQARHDCGLSQVEAAKKLKKPQTYVSKCELGERRVDIIELKLFAKIYRKPIDYFTD